MSQKQKILRLLQERGERGVHSFEFYEMRMPRGAAAICDLRKEGHNIDGVDETFRGEAGGKRYFLRSDQLVGAGVGSAPSHGQSQSSPYDPYSDWA
ncbi:MAG TPA: helix-turn-helix domain-containing protein [Solirubrobacterales bacterium]|nr:helix-turn-helix domain-containing protein [Solirubrobacterales bacterium]